MPSYKSKAKRDSWYNELVIQFEDGTQEHFYIEMTQTGTHIPRPIAKPAEWTRLGFHKCPRCPLADRIRYCPAAESLETTLLRLRDHYSYEPVRAVATDGAKRQTIVERPLQEVGTALVHLAVFSSGCPIGKAFRPMLRDLRPFATNEELSKHLLTKIALKHRGQLDDSRQEVLDKLMPLREVFANLCKRLPTSAKGDAVANAIISLDASTLGIALELDEALEDLAEEMGWAPGTIRRTSGEDTTAFQVMMMEEGRAVPRRQAGFAANDAPPPIPPRMPEPPKPSLWKRFIRTIGID